MSNCQVCHYTSVQPASSCDVDCVNGNGEYDSTCVRKWGACLRRIYQSTFRSVRFLYPQIYIYIPPLYYKYYLYYIRSHQVTGHHKTTNVLNIAVIDERK